MPGPDAVEALAGKLGLDTTDFKTAVSSANRELRVIESGFRASAAALGDWTKSADGMESRVDALTKSIDLQEAKVAALRQEYQRIADAEGESSKAAQDMAIKVNKETEQLNKMKVELTDSEKALGEMTDESKKGAKATKDLGDEQEKTAKKSETLTKVLGGLKTGLKVGIAAIAALGAAALAAAAGIAKLVLDAADMAGQLVDTSLKTGLSTTTLQELAYVGDQVGTSVEDMTSSMAKLTRSMAGAKGGTGPAADAFAALGVSVTDANGSLRSQEDVFRDVIDALGRMPEGAERDALAMEIFGKSAQELNPLIKAGSAEIARLTEEAHKMGAVMDEESVAALESFGDELASLKAGLKGTLGTLAVAFLPAFQGMTGAAKTYLGQFSEIVKNADGDFTKMATGIGQLLGQIITDITKNMPGVLAAGLEIIKGIGKAILDALPTLIPAMANMISSLLGFIIQALPMLMQAGVQIILALVNGIVPQLPNLIQAAVQMIITLVNGLADNLPTLLEMIATVIPEVVIVLINNLPLLIKAALKLIIALVDGLIKALPILIEYIPDIVTAILDALIEAAPMLFGAAMELIVKLALGITQVLFKIAETAPKIVGALADAVAELPSALAEIGKQIVIGLWNGIMSQYEWIKNNFTEWLANLLKSITDFLGIQSPSKKFMGIGKNMALGLGKGFQETFKQVAATANKSIGTLGGMQLNVAGAGAGAASPAAPAPISLNIEKVEINNGDDYKTAARKIMAEINRVRR